MAAEVTPTRTFAVRMSFDGAVGAAVRRATLAAIAPIRQTELAAAVLPWVLDELTTVTTRSSAAAADNETAARPHVVPVISETRRTDKTTYDPRFGLWFIVIGVVVVFLAGALVFVQRRGVSFSGVVIVVGTALCSMWCIFVMIKVLGIEQQSVIVSPAVAWIDTYRSALCNGSAASAFPFRAAALPDDGRCHLLQHYGSDAVETNVFAKAQCVEECFERCVGTKCEEKCFVTPGSEVHVFIATSLEACVRGVPVAFSPANCTTDAFPGIYPEEPLHVMFSCRPTEDLERFAELAAASPTRPRDAETAAFALAADDRWGGGNATAFLGTRRQKPQQVVLTADDPISSRRALAAYTADDARSLQRSAGMRFSPVVTRQSGCVSLNVAANATATNATATNDTEPEACPVHAPKFWEGEGAPDGAHFNGFGAGAEAAAAGRRNAHRGALRYHGAAGSEFDLGAHDDFTLSFWFKGSHTTRGFVMAVVDAWTVAETHESPVLGAMQEVRNDESHDIVLAVPENYTLYSAVHVDGAANVVRFLADGVVGSDKSYGRIHDVFTTDSFNATLNVVADATWAFDADAIDIFNEEWHFLAIAGSRLGQRRHFQLHIDGHSRDDKHRKCFLEQRDIAAIDPAGESSLGRAASDEVTMDGAVVFVGHLDAAVYGLQVHEGPTPALELFLALSTVDMRADRETTFVGAIFVVAIIFVFVWGLLSVFVVLRSIFDLHFDVDTDLDAEELVETLDELGEEVELPSVSIPGIDVGVPAINAPDMNMPAVNVALPTAALPLPYVDVRLPDPSIETPSMPAVALPGAPGLPGVPGAPNVALPAVTVPGVTLPGVTLPGVTLPGVTLPGVTLPGVALPGVTLPGVTLPGVALPGLALPGLALPGLALPGVALPGVTLPGVPNAPALPKIPVIKVPRPPQIPSLRIVLPIVISIFQCMALYLKAFTFPVEFTAVFSFVFSFFSFSWVFDLALPSGVVLSTTMTTWLLVGVFIFALVLIGGVGFATMKGNATYHTLVVKIRRTLYLRGIGREYSDAPVEMYSSGVDVFLGNLQVSVTSREALLAASREMMTASEDAGGQPQTAQVNVWAFPKPTHGNDDGTKKGERKVAKPPKFTSSAVVALAKASCPATATTPEVMEAAMRVFGVAPHVFGGGSTAGGSHLRAFLEDDATSQQLVADFPKSDGTDLLDRTAAFMRRHLNHVHLRDALLAAVPDAVAFMRHGGELRWTIAMRMSRKDAAGGVLPLLTADEQKVLLRLYRAHMTTDEETVAYLVGHGAAKGLDDDAVMANVDDILASPQRGVGAFAGFCRREKAVSPERWAALRRAALALLGMKELLSFHRTEKMDAKLVEPAAPELIDANGTEFVENRIDNRVPYACMADRKWLAEEVARMKADEEAEANGTANAQQAPQQDASPVPLTRDGPYRDSAYVEEDMAAVHGAPRAPHSLLRGADAFWYYRETPSENGAVPVRSICDQCDAGEAHLLWRELGPTTAPCRGRCHGEDECEGGDCPHHHGCGRRFSEGDFAWVCPDDFSFPRGVAERVMCRECEFAGLNHQHSVLHALVRDSHRYGVTDHALANTADGVELLHGTLTVRCRPEPVIELTTDRGTAARGMALSASSVCPQHGGELALAERDGEYAVRRDHPRRFACRCAGRCELSALRGAPEDDCSAVEFFACPHEDCDFAVCRVCVDKSLGKQEVIQRLVIGKLYAAIMSTPIYAIADFVYLPIIELAVAVVFCRFPMQCIYQWCYHSFRESFGLATLFANLAIIAFGGGLVMVLLDIAVHRKELILTENVIDPGRISEQPLITPWARLWCNMLPSDWSAITELDDSSANALYSNYEFKWVAIHGPLLVFKVIIVVAVVTLPQGSLGQLYALVSIETLQLLVSLWTSPFTDPWVDVMAKVGFLHQIAQLCCVGLFRHFVYRRPESRGDIPAVMIAVAVIYFTFVLLVLGYVVAYPRVKAKLAEKADDAEFEESERCRRAGKPYPPQVDTEAAGNPAPPTSKESTEPFATPV